MVGDDWMKFLQQATLVNTACPSNVADPIIHPKKDGHTKILMSKPLLKKMFCDAEKETFMNCPHDKDLTDQNKLFLNPTHAVTGCCEAVP